MFKISDNAKKAFLIGTLCSFSYLAVYIARNVLGSISPQMIEGGVVTNETVGTLSSIFFITYAFGQLINGKLGDKIKGKYMISFGLILAGIFHFIFGNSFNCLPVTFISYALAGYSLSMIYGPMTKTVSENVELVYATRCSLGYTFSSFLASPITGLLASYLIWKSVVSSTSVILVAMGIICYIVFTLFENKGFVAYNKFSSKQNKGSDFKVLIKRQIIKFSFISILTGIVRTTVVFWLPTYFSQYLEFTPKASTLIFTVSSFAISSATFIAVFMYERLKRDMDKTILISFVASAICFLVVFIIKVQVINLVFIVLAIIACNCAATMLFSRYCPSLYDTGMVSSATGFIDFLSYMAASISSKIFANATATIGWKGLIAVWFLLMVIGVIVALPKFKLQKKEAE